MLTELAIKAAKSRSKPYRMTDGQGLYLLVRPDGCSLVALGLSSTESGNRNTLSLGVHPDISLKKARERRDEARRLLMDGVNHEWLMRFIEHRIGDPRIIRLIRKWLKAGVLVEGQWQATEVQKSDPHKDL